MDEELDNVLEEYSRNADHPWLAPQELKEILIAHIAYYETYISKGNIVGYRPGRDIDVAVIGLDALPDMISLAESGAHALSCWLPIPGPDMFSLGYRFLKTISPRFYTNDDMAHLTRKYGERLEHLTQINLMSSKLHEYHREQMCLRFFDLYRYAGQMVGMDFETYFFDIGSSFMEPEKEGDLVTLIKESEEIAGYPLFDIERRGDSEIYFPTEGLFKVFEREPYEGVLNTIQWVFSPGSSNPLTFRALIDIYVQSGLSDIVFFDRLMQMGMPKPIYSDSQFPDNADELNKWVRDNEDIIHSFFMSSSLLP